LLHTVQAHESLVEHRQGDGRTNTKLFNVFLLAMTPYDDAS